MKLNELNTADFYCRNKYFFSEYLICILQKTGLEGHESKEVMTELEFLGELSLLHEHLCYEVHLK